VVVGCVVDFVVVYVYEVIVGGQLYIVFECVCVLFDRA